VDRSRCSIVYVGSEQTGLLCFVSVEWLLTVHNTNIPFTARGRLSDTRTPEYHRRDTPRCTLLHNLHMLVTYKTEEYVVMQCDAVLCA
jgi:hypothetical protein